MLGGILYEILRRFTVALNFILPACWLPFRFGSEFIFDFSFSLQLLTHDFASLEMALVTAIQALTWADVSLAVF